ncbi:MAG: SNF2-related protein, partial [Planctomycetota bacterium]
MSALIEIPPSSDATAAVVSSLPGGRWNRHRGCWTARRSPAAAARLVDAGLADLDEETRREADSFRRMEAFRESIRDGSADLPPIPRSKIEPWRHQIEAYHWVRSGRSVLNMGMGLGKSKVVVDAVCNGDDETVLVLCPKAVLGVWRREFSLWSTRSYTLHVADRGTTAKKAEAIRHFLTTRSGLRIVVANYESASTGKLAELLLKTTWSRVVLDESHRVKTGTTRVGRFAVTLCQAAGTADLLSGTFLAQNPLDGFNQLRCLDEGVF